MKKFFVTLLMACFLVSSMGCSLLTKPLQDNELAVEMIVTVAAGRVLNNNPTWAPKTVTITATAIQLIDGKNLVTLDQLEEYVIAEIPWDKLLPEEEILLRLFVSTTKADLEAYLQSKGVTTPEKELISAAKVLSWINRVAVGYTARS